MVNQYIDDVSKLNNQDSVDAYLDGIFDNEDFYRHVYGIQNMDEMLRRIQEHAMSQNIEISDSKIMKYLQNNL